MKTNSKNTTQAMKRNSSIVSENYTEPPALTESEKKALRVKDGQNNHHVDERGGN